MMSSAARVWPSFTSAFASRFRSRSFSASMPGRPLSATAGTAAADDFSALESRALRQYRGCETSPQQGPAPVSGVFPADENLHLLEATIQVIRLSPCRADLPAHRPVRLGTVAGFLACCFPLIVLSDSGEPSDPEINSSRPCPLRRRYSSAPHGALWQFSTCPVIPACCLLTPTVAVRFFSSAVSSSTTIASGSPRYAGDEPLQRGQRRCPVPGVLSQERLHPPRRAIPGRLRQLPARLTVPLLPQQRPDVRERRQPRPGLREHRREQGTQLTMQLPQPSPGLLRWPRRPPRCLVLSRSMIMRWPSRTASQRRSHRDQPAPRSQTRTVVPGTLCTSAHEEERM